jgi:hypothetical protein
MDFQLDLKNNAAINVITVQNIFPSILAGYVHLVTLLIELVIFLCLLNISQAYWRCLGLKEHSSQNTQRGPNILYCFPHNYLDLKHPVT